MAIELQYASELVTAFILVISAIVLLSYTRNRIRNLPDEEKSLGRPLYVATVALLILGIASLVNYGIHAGYLAWDPLLSYYQLSVIGPGLLTISALMILGWKKYYVVPIGMMAAVAAIAFLIPLLSLPMSPQIFIEPFNLALFALPIGLFGYLTKQQKRVTSFALFMISTTYPLFAITGATYNLLIISVIIGLRMFAAALAIVAFSKPDIGFSLELGGYSFSMTGIAFFLTSFQLAAFIQFDPLLNPVTPEAIETIVSLLLVTISATLGMISGTYTLGRWKKSRNTVTLMLGSYLFIAGIAFLLVALVNIDFVTGINWLYTSQIVSIVVLVFLNIAAFLALDWKKGVLIPIIITIPILILLFVSYPTHPNNIEYRTVLMIITEILQNVIPLGLFGALWWRMRKTNSPGRSRALFLAIGIIFLLLAVSGGVLVTYITSTFLVIAFTLWILAVTGYADKLLKTAG